MATIDTKLEPIPLTYKFDFGKHVGETLNEVINDDPGYVQWCLNELDWFVLSKDVHEKMVDSLFDVVVHKQIHSLESDYSDWDDDSSNWGQY